MYLSQSNSLPITENCLTLLLNFVFGEGCAARRRSDQIRLLDHKTLAISKKYPAFAGHLRVVFFDDKLAG